MTLHPTPHIAGAARRMFGRPLLRALAPLAAAALLAGCAVQPNGKGGMPVGVHVDARSLDDNPSLLSDAAMMKMPVFVYSVEGDASLAAALRRARQGSGRWPSGVIVDADAFCARLQ